ncbi:MAG: hypothetical protein WBQ94_04135 [Terracidiphilus sp.]
MRTKPLYLAALITGLVCFPMDRRANAMEGQAFAGAIPAAGAEGMASEVSTPESRLYADGTRAINEGRWPDAQAIFSKVANERSEHADGARYWRAYAENKMGQAKLALDTCAMLKRDYPTSSWIHECGALAIEIHAQSGKPAAPKAGDDDDLKLLALNSLMQKNESQALGQIQEILNSSDSSEKLKKEALFILGNHYSDATYAQVVRISYVEGDVRIARGEQDEKPAGATWEKAVADLPLEAGFSLVTGEGRAEVEFEDASTLYLGANSVLTFNDLHTRSGIPHTELALLTGTVTLHIRPNVAGESYFLKTPTDEMYTGFPHKSYMRVTSYEDAMALTPQEDGFLHLLAFGDEKVTAGQTEFYRGGLRVNATAAESEAGFADWDKWVADRVAQRKAAMIEMMKASGLSSPIPGLADMKDQGTFFECAPYGTCWEPKVANHSQEPGDKVSQSRPSSSRNDGQPARVMQASFTKTRGVAGAPAIQAIDPADISSPWDDFAYFPCVPSTIRYRVVRDPVTGQERVVETLWGANPFAYRWAVCHAGTWIHRRHHYAWVCGHKMHHLEPVRWVKSGHRVAFVPIHPYDVKGRPPINRREEVFAVNNKNGLTIEKLKFDPARTVEYLKVPPREFRTTYLRPLSRADVPRMEAHSLKEPSLMSKGVVARAGVPLSFDPKMHSFMMPHQVMKGDKSVTVMAPVSNRSGNLQATGGSFAGGHGGYSGGGVSHSGVYNGGGGSRGGSNSGGGGSRGGSSGGGGGSRGGGGGGGNSGGGSHGGGGSSGGGSTSSSSTSSGGSGAASSAGGHH